MTAQHVTIVIAPSALGSTITIPLEMLQAANDIARAQDRHGKQIKIELAGTQRGKLTLTGGLTVYCEKSLQDIKQTDLVFVPGMWGNPLTAIRKHRKLVAWLNLMHQQHATLCAIATGVFFIAEGGLLDNLAATTHWRYFDLFARRYPHVKLQRKRFITQDQQIFCTGSVNAARDIMLHFVEILFGESISSQVSRHFTHELKRSYESLLLNRDQSSTHHDETIIKVQEWLQDHYTQTIQIADLADRFQLSTRSLNRRFKQAANTTPLQYLQDLRITQAKELLKQSNLVISEIADRVGYQDASYFTGLFKKINSVTPNEYRRLVRNKLFVAEGGNQPGES